MNPHAPSRVGLGFVLAATLALGCAGHRSSAGFELSYAPSPTDEIAAITTRVRETPPGTIVPAVVVVPPAPLRGFSVFALPTGLRLGQTQDAIDGRPVLTGDLVIAHVPGGVAAWNLDGTRRWQVEDHGMPLTGVARDRTRVALTLGGGGVMRRRGTLVVVGAYSGRVSIAREVPHALGVPAMAGDDLFVPWDGQNLSVFDAESGDEVARLRSRDDTYAFARREGDTVFFGARALYRFGPEVVPGRRDQVPHATFDHEELPGRPPFMNDPYTAPEAGVDARERVRTVWRPDPATASGTPAFAGSTVYALFHRDLFAMDARTGAVRWAYVHPADLSGVEVTREGVMAVDENGRAVFVSAARGVPVWRAEFRVPSVQAVFQVPLEFSPRGGVTDEVALTPVEGLLRAAGGTDTRLVPAQVFAIRALGAIDSPEATRAIVSVLAQRNLPAEVRTAVGNALAERTNGADAMLEALQMHYDYVRGTQSAPVGLLARGLVAAHERRGVSALIAHLHDPATPAVELPMIVAALRELRDPAAVPGLMDFLRMYHADEGALVPVTGGDPIDDRPVGEQTSIDSALEQSALAVAELGGPDAQDLLEELAHCASTSRIVRESLQRAQGSNTPAPAPNEGPENPDMVFHQPPPRLSSEMIGEALGQHRYELLECLRGAPSRPAQVRVQFFYDGDGRVSNVTVNPASFQACMAPRIEHVRLPSSSAAREIGTWYLPTSN